MRVFLGFLLLFGGAASAQFRVVVRITNEDTRQPIAGASVVVKGSNKGRVSDSVGLVRLEGMIGGSYEIQVSCTGFVTRGIKVAVPLRGLEDLAVMLEPDVAMLGDVIVSSSRINGRIKDLPTRVEVLGTESGISPLVATGKIFTMILFAGDTSLDIVIAINLFILSEIAFLRI